MGQFTVCRNKNLQTRSAIPFLLDVQNDLLDDLETRVVVPLSPLSAMKGKTLRTLMHTSRDLRCPLRGLWNKVAL